MGPRSWRLAALRCGKRRGAQGTRRAGERASALERKWAEATMRVVLEEVTEAIHKVPRFVRIPAIMPSCGSKYK